MIRKAQLVGFGLLVGGLAFGGIGWTLADNELTGFGFGLVALVVLLCGGMLLHSTSD